MRSAGIVLQPHDMQYIKEVFLLKELFLISQDINDENFDTTDYVQKLSSI